MDPRVLLAHPDLPFTHPLNLPQITPEEIERVIASLLAMPCPRYRDIFRHIEAVGRKPEFVDTMRITEVMLPRLPHVVSYLRSADWMEVHEFLETEPRNGPAFMSTGSVYFANIDDAVFFKLMFG